MTCFVFKLQTPNVKYIWLKGELGVHFTSSLINCECCLVSFQVISAQQLPKLNKDKPKSIVDPFVKVEIYGVPADQASAQTSYINNNGKCH